MKIDLKTFNQLNLVLMFGITVLSNIFVGMGIGWLLDKIFNHSFWMIVFMLLGIFSGLYFGIKDLLREAERYDKTQNSTKKTDNKDNNNINN